MRIVIRAALAAILALTVGVGGTRRAVDASLTENR
jgi:hypothetical protein